jgi:serine/threonine protein kinase
MIQKWTYGRWASRQSNWHAAEHQTVCTLNMVAMDHFYSLIGQLDPYHVLIRVMKDPPPTLGEPPNGEGEYSKQFHEFVEFCLRKNPNERPTAKMLLQHSFLKKVIYLFNFIYFFFFF